jgi:DNA polymerase III subunit gamma/tau
VSYLVLARKWRPQTFSDLVGQEHVCRTLQNAIDSGRVAHAFLFTGARGVGKTTAARLLAKALQCDEGQKTEPCNNCPACISITAGNAPDVFEIDGASNTGVDDIRELRENIKYLPSSCRFKIFIIDEVHMLSTNAFNALLKTLEEPPAHVKFIFATTEPHKVPVTILSRCQRFDFKRISLQKIVARLRYIADQEKIAITDIALTAIARKGDGSMRDSLSTLDQVLAFCGDNVSDDEVTGLLGVVDRRLLLETSRAVFSRDHQTAFDIIKRVDDQGYNMRQYCQELIGHFRNLTLVRLTKNSSELLDLAEGELAELTGQANGAQLEDLQRHLTILLKAETEMASSGFSRLILEMALVKMCSLAPVVPINQILARLKELERPHSVRPSPASHQSKTVAPVAKSAPEPAKSAAKPAEVPKSMEQDDTGGSWSGFVAYVKQRKVRLGSLLESGRPIVISAESLKIGFPTGSFSLVSLKDPDSAAALAELTQQYFHTRPTIEMIAISSEAKDLPPSILEKKTLQANEHLEKLNQEARNHPTVTSALEIFGGDIVEVQDIKKDTAETK